MTGFRRGDAIAGAAFAAGVALVALAQLPVRETSLKLKETSDAYLLPPPDHLVVMSLGYRAAIADLLWANVLVTQGIRMEQRRRYDTVEESLDAIIALDPKFREPYLMAETLLTFQAVEVDVEDARRAREILERAVREYPLDAELWLQLGMFVSFIAAPSYIKDPTEQDRWRREGAAYLARAAELGVKDPSIQWQAMGGAGILKKAGHTQAAISFYQRIAATTDDEELRQKAEEQIRALSDTAAMGAQMEKAVLDAEAEEQNRLFAALMARRPLLGQIRRTHYPGRNEDFLLAGGPAPDAAACAGGSSSTHADEPICAPDWVELTRRISESTLP